MDLPFDTAICRQVGQETPSRLGDRGQCVLYTEMRRVQEERGGWNLQKYGLILFTAIQIRNTELSKVA